VADSHPLCRGNSIQLLGSSLSGPYQTGIVSLTAGNKRVKEHRDPQGLAEQAGPLAPRSVGTGEAGPGRGHKTDRESTRFNKRDSSYLTARIARDNPQVLEETKEAKRGGQEASDYSGLPQTDLERLIETGELKAREIRKGKAKMISRRSLEALT
jgi:hypothetical protein